MMEAEKGRELWASLHTFAGMRETPDMQLVFMEDWLAKVGVAMGCPTCFHKVVRFTRRWAPDYGEGFETWAFCLHDYINKELGKKMFKPELTLALLLQKGIIH